MKKSVKVVLAGVVATTALGVVAAVIRDSGGSQKVEAVVVSRSMGTVAESATGETTVVNAPSAAVGEVLPSVPAVTIVEPASDLGVVPGLANVDGKLELRGDDFMIAKRELDFGPDEWLVSTASPSDLDGDQTTESWWSELSGMVGRNVTVLGDVDDDDVDVYEIDGVGLRPLYSSVAPWSDDWQASDVKGQPAEKLKAGLTADEAARIALAEVPGVVVSAQIDVNDGHPYWELDVRSQDGSLYDVEIDAMTGKVVEIDRD